MNKFSKFVLATGIGYLTLSCLSNKDFDHLQDVLLTKIYKLEPKLINLFYELDMILNFSYNERDAVNSESVQQRINKVSEQIENLKMEKMAKLLVKQINKGK